MKKKAIILICCLFSSLVLPAQNKDLIIELVSKEIPKKNTMAIPEKYSEIWDYNDSVVAYQSPFWAGKDRLADKITIVYDNRQFDVETLSEIAIAPNANLLVKLGHRNYYSPAKREFVVLYYDLNGNKMKEITKHIGGNFSMSKNGFFAITGKIKGHDISEGSFLSLYDKNGEELLTKGLGPDNWARDIKISPNGKYIALVYTSLRAKAIGDRYNLLILKNDGTVLIDKRYIDLIFNHLIFSPNEDYLFGTANDYACLIDIKNQKLKWEKSIDYRSGKGPVLFIEFYNSILLQTRSSGIWTMNLIDIETGDEIFKTELPDKQPPTYNKSLFQKSKDEFIIKGAGFSYHFKIKLKN